MSGRPRRKSPLAAIIFGVLAVLVGLAVWTVRLLDQGERAMLASDQAFHTGNLRDAMRSAEAALRAYVPGSDHVRSAEDRLRAIARGSEAEGELMVARSAWEALRIYDERTDYPGRGPTRYRAEADAALVRIDRLFREKVGGDAASR